ncbi:salutaridine reductase-like [Bidens hawaiensis]|uniref:salutaridine reductase-like n=1 Tax=Bidens hawaiensis TaxID=980011 RepID=UPI00404AD461
MVDDKKYKDDKGYMQVTDENVDLVRGFWAEPYDLGEECLNINYYGTKGVTEAFVPLLQLSKSPRIVNVSSAFGDLHWFHNEELKQELIDVESLTEERINEVIHWFLSDFKATKLRENGWPLTASAYKVSKAAINAYTRLIAQKFKNILVNAVHPGFVVTDLTYQTLFLTVEEGAKPVVLAALLSDDGPSGAYFNKMEIAPFTLEERPI